MLWAFVQVLGQRLRKTTGDLSEALHGERRARPLPAAVVDLTPTPDIDAHRCAQARLSALFRRVFGDQVTQCPRCQDHVRVLAFLSDPVVTARILEHLDIA